MGQWRAWQRTALSEVRGERVLELAFGTGDLLLDLQAMGGLQTLGLDLSPQMVQVARRKLRRHGVWVPLLRGRAQQLPLAGASIDTIVSTFPAPFILSEQTLEEMARVLKRDGRAVIVAMATLGARSPWDRFLEWAYRVTGQRGPLPDLGPRLAAAGLRYRMAWRAVNGDRVLLVLLERAP
jgi:ubiquinone/menaquinone biosynthesis C-methylase UbiE